MRSILRPLRRWSTMPVVVALAGLELASFAVPASAAHASVPPNPVFKSSAPFGAWKNAGYNVYNNEWNTKEAGPQTIWANSYHDWGVSSKQANTTSVKTYPSVQTQYNNRPYSSFGKIRSTFTESMPSAATKYDGEAAYDIWLNNYKIELMMWVDNHGQTPAGNVIAHVTIYGQKFTVWQSGSDMFSFVRSGNETTGMVHILSAWRWLVQHGRLSSSTTMTQFNFGFEICSTNNVPLDFNVTQYKLATSRKS
jgi:hypothetical protein